MSKDSSDTTVGLDKKFSAKVEEQNKKAIKGNQKNLMQIMMVKLLKKILKYLIKIQMLKRNMVVRLLIV